MSIRVLHCRTDVGRNAWALAQAEKELGLESTVLVYHTAYLQYPSDVDLRLRDRSAPGKAMTVGRAILQAARDYDIIHFNGGRSFMPGSPGRLSWLGGIDLRYLKARGKGIVVTFQGCDLRQAGPTRERYGVSACDESVGCDSICSRDLDEHKARIVREFDRYADRMFALNPDLLWLLPERAEFLPYTTVDPRDWTPRPLSLPGPGEPFRILHAPTKRGVKGTRFVVEAVDALREDHPELELVIVEGMPRLYETAHLVVDQLLLGWYGGFAVEAMALGRPVVCFIRGSDLGFVPRGMRESIPVVNATPGSIKEVLRGLIEERERLAVLGERCREYVEHWHDPMQIAKNMKTVYEEILGEHRRVT